MENIFKVVAGKRLSTTDCLLFLSYLISFLSLFELLPFSVLLTSGYEILFCDPTTAAQVTDGASKLVGKEWDSWTLTLGWPVLGIWSGSMDGTDINNVDRSPSGRYLATCDDFGKVNLFNFPAIKPKGSSHNTYNGHSSHVTSVKWASILSSSSRERFVVPTSDDYLISTGGDDKCVFQWKHSQPGEDLDTRGGKKRGSSSLSYQYGDDDETALNGRNRAGEEMDDDFDLPTGGDEFMAIKPWIGAIVSPSAWNHPDQNKISSFYASLSEYSRKFRALTDVKEAASYSTAFNVFSSVSPSVYRDLSTSSDLVMQKLYETGLNDISPPNSDELELEFVYGYRGYDCRNNLLYLNLPSSSSFSSVSDRGSKKGGEGQQGRYLLYYAAALGILLDVNNMKQSYFRGHNDDILSMASHTFYNSSSSSPVPEQVIVATGQIGTGSIFVWEVPSMQTLSVISSTKQKSVLFLQFSSNGRLLVSVGEDKSLVIIDWKSQSIIATNKMDGNTVFDMSILGRGSGGGGGAATSTGNKVQLITVGDKLLKLWTIDGRNITSSKFVTSTTPEGQLQNFLCVTELFGKFLVGCEDSSVYVILPTDKGIKSKVFSHCLAAGSISVDKPAATAPKSGKKSTKSINNSCSITAMAVFESLLFTGAKDGSIVIWDGKGLQGDGNELSSITFFSLSQFSLELQAKQIQAISVSYSSSSKLLIVVGTRGCDIIEFLYDTSSNKVAQLSSEKNSSGFVMQGHFNEELWGLTTHPFLPEFVTVGDDKTLRIHHLHQRKCLALVSLGLFSRSCCYSTDGNLLAVGFGGRVGKGKEQGDGTVRLYSISYAGSGKGEETRIVSKLSERKDAKQWISDVRFSSDSRTLVAGCHDCKIYIYNVNTSSSVSSSAGGKGATKGYELSLRSVFAKHNAVINHLDLSIDGRFMQSNCAGYEILFSDTTTGKQITNPNEVKDVQWATWTCTLGWPVQGIWGNEAKGSDINAVCRSKTGHLLATSDDLGKIHLYRYPVLPSAATNDGKPAKKGSISSNTGERSLSFSGHSSHVMNIRWSIGDEYLLSVGGADKCIFQWRHVMSEISSSSVSHGGGKGEKRVSIQDENEDDDNDSVSSSKGAAVSHADAIDFDDEPFGPLGGGDESLAVKPWVGAVRPPKNPPPISEKQPTLDISLSWVHGYSSSGISHHQNVFYNSESEILYPAASLVVSLKRSSLSNSSSADWKQSYCKGHDDDILCVAMSSNRKYLATGQIASKRLKGKASVYVWDSLQCNILSKMEGCHSRGVTALSFNSDGNLLVSVGMDDNFTHIVWSDNGGNWSRCQQIASVKGDRLPVSLILFLSCSALSFLLLPSCSTDRRVLLNSFILNILW
jgi:WD40 repeat protein